MADQDPGSNSKTANSSLAKESPQSDGGDKESKFQVPQITLPKGGGAIKSIDEKFEVNAANGTAGMSLPLPLSPGRGGMTPALSLSYNSGGGNGLFGIGWSMGVASISRKTDKRLPRYREGDEDTFSFTGVEDLVPYLRETGESDPSTDDYKVKRYRPRIEGGFSKIEKITHYDHGVYWKVTGKDNRVTIFGRSPATRIADPEDETRIFRWLADLSYDDKGNWIKYEYKQEDLEQVPSDLHEKHRLNGNAPFANQYLKRVKYGNHGSYRPGHSLDPVDPIADGKDYHFELVFDYGEHASEKPMVGEEALWEYRSDAFSSYRSGFEIRTNRLCQRVLMFHIFPELGAQPCLVKSLDLEYEPSSFSGEGQSEVTYLKSASLVGYIKKEDNSYSKKSFPPVEYSYQKLNWDRTIHEVAQENIVNAPDGLTNNYQWVDLYGEGISGILSEQAGGWYYKENLGGDENQKAQFTPARQVGVIPSFNGMGNGSVMIQDLESNGLKQAVVNTPDLKGFFQLDNDSNEIEESPASAFNVKAFRFFESIPNIDWSDPYTRFIDLNGDGKPELVISEENAFIWYASEGKAGYSAAEFATKTFDEDQGPAIVFSDQEQTIFLADMSGDGLTDIVRIRNGEICYWANKGYGKFSAKVSMSNAPWFDYPDQFNPALLHLADVSGTGATDIIYLGKNKFKAFINLSGNGWSDVHKIDPFVQVDNRGKLSVIDLLGTGTSCIVWSTDLPEQPPMRYIDLMGSKKPHVMIGYTNNLGKEIKVEYKSSTYFYLEDKKAGNHWITRLPFPVQVISHLTTIDYISKSVLNVSYSYHHGHYDHREREFRGFAYVEQTDAESFDHVKDLDTLDIPPILTKNWFHTGAYVRKNVVSQLLKDEYFKFGQPEDADESDYDFPDSTIEGATEMEFSQLSEAYRALKGKPLRAEIYSRDGSEKENIPYTITETNYTVRQVQPKAENEFGVFMALGNETLIYSCERNVEDPRVSHQMVLDSDEFGHPLKTMQLAYPRQASDAEPEQLELHAIVSEMTFENETNDFYRLGIPLSQKQFEIEGLARPSGRYFTPEEIKETLDDAKANLFAWSINRYWEGDYKSLALPMNTEVAVLHTDSLSEIYGSKLTEDMMEEAGYFKRTISEDEEEKKYWWNGGLKMSYLEEDDFYLPHKTSDPFSNETIIGYDDYHLAAVESTDAKGNEVSAEIGYRTLGPKKLVDPNDNISEAITDELGLVIATSIRGTEGAEEKGDDPIISYSRVDDPTIEDIINDPSKYLQRATSFFYYSMEKWEEGEQPPHFVTLQRETHVKDLVGGEETKIQIRLGYSDGFGRSLANKLKVEDGPLDCEAVDTGDGRWLTSGRTVYNNKEKPIKQYEPAYAPTWKYQNEAEFSACGVTPVIYYDPAGRVIKTETPKGFLSKVEFDSWTVKTYDENDTCEELEQVFIDQLQADADEKYALDKAREHADTPAVVLLDSLGREYKSIQQAEKGGEELITHTQFNIQGQPLEITDPRQFTLNKSNPVRAIHNFVYEYDLVGNPLHTQSVDAGESWGLINVLGNPVHSWNARGFRSITEYDELQRPTKVTVKDGDLGLDNVVQMMGYGEPDESASTADKEEAKAKNLRGRLIKTYDQAGTVEISRFDFHGLPLETKQQIREEYKDEVDWDNEEKMLSEIYLSSTTYDALGRGIEVIKPDGSQTRVTFHPEGWLKNVQVKLKDETDLTEFVESIEYNAKGQRTKLVYGNGVRTTYAYEAETFRLKQLRSYRRETDGSDTALQEIDYLYDPVGNIVRITDISHQKVFNGGSAIAPEQEYTYDALYQLKKATGREHKALNQSDHRENAEEFKQRQFIHLNDAHQLAKYMRTYDYDAAGNLLNIHHSGENVYNHANTISPVSNRGVSSETESDPAKVEALYDAAGNLSKLDHLRELNWNYRNNISSAVVVEREVNGEPINDAEYYVYDGSGQRVRKVTETYNSSGDLLQKEEKIYLNGLELKRKYQGSTLKEDRSALHIMDDQKRIAIVYHWALSSSFTTGGNKTHYQLGNHLGSASMELDASGQLISYEEYFPFGGTAFTTGKDVEVKLKEYSYTGKERDDCTGLYYYGARYYAPWMGRWLSADPAGTVDGLNLFIYTRNNSIKYLDIIGKAIVAADVAEWMDEKIDVAKAYWMGDDTDVVRNTAVVTPTTILKGTTDLLRFGATAGECYPNCSATDYAQEAGRAGGIVLTVVGPVSSATVKAASPVRTTLAAKELRKFEGTLSVADDSKTMYAHPSQGSTVGGKPLKTKPHGEGGRLTSKEAVQRRGGHRQVTENYGVERAADDVRGGTVEVSQGQVVDMGYTSGQLNVGKQGVTGRTVTDPTKMASMESRARQGIEVLQTPGQYAHLNQTGALVGNAGRIAGRPEDSASPELGSPPATDANDVGTLNPEYSYSVEECLPEEDYYSQTTWLE